MLIIETIFIGASWRIFLFSLLELGIKFFTSISLDFEISKMKIMYFGIKYFMYTFTEIGHSLVAIYIHYIFGIMSSVWELRVGINIV